MLAKLNLVKDQKGWQLLTDINIEACSICRNPLSEKELPLYFCPQYLSFYHPDCEKQAGSWSCASIADEHIHYNIIDIQHPGWMNKILTMMGLL